MIKTRQQKITIYNVDVIVDKINKFVKYYAHKRNIDKWLYSVAFEFLYKIDIHPDNSPVYKTTIADLYMIDFEKMFYAANLDYVYDNSPFIKNKSNLCEIINAYLKSYYKDYSEIESFINKMLYSFPDKLNENDFIKLNELYSKVKLEPTDDTNKL